MRSIYRAARAWGYTRRSSLLLAARYAYRMQCLEDTLALAEQRERLCGVGTLLEL